MSAGSVGRGELSNIFESELTTNINRLYDAYKVMLQKSAVGTTEEFERQQLNTAVVSVSMACQCLLDQIQEMRVHAVISEGIGDGEETAATATGEDSSKP
jgi:hypothetical protein